MLLLLLPHIACTESIIVVSDVKVDRPSMRSLEITVLGKTAIAANVSPRA